MAFKQYGYTLTEHAESDIDAILDYMIDDLSNIDAARRFADELEQKLEEICKTPKTGRIVDNEYLKCCNIRRVLVENYIVYYTIDEETQNIVVLRVVYGGRDQSAILKQ